PYQNQPFRSDPRSETGIPWATDNDSQFSDDFLIDRFLTTYYYSYHVKADPRMESDDINLTQDGHRI
ncbi:MAG: hypothetical protein ABIK68_22845, partial [bacterium]